MDDAREFSESTREALADFGEITRMELDELNEHDEEEEEALMQEVALSAWVRSNSEGSA